MVSKAISTVRNRRDGSIPSPNDSLFDYQLIARLSIKLAFDLCFNSLNRFTRNTHGDKSSIDMNARSLADIPTDSTRQLSYNFQNFLLIRMGMNRQRVACCFSHFADFRLMPFAKLW